VPRDGGGAGPHHAPIRRQVDAQMDGAFGGATGPGHGGKKTGSGRPRRSGLGHAVMSSQNWGISLGRGGRGAGIGVTGPQDRGGRRALVGGGENNLS